MQDQEGDVAPLNVNGAHVHLGAENVALVRLGAENVALVQGSEEDRDVVRGDVRNVVVAADQNVHVRVVVREVVPAAVNAA